MLNGKFGIKVGKRGSYSWADGNEVLSVTEGGELRGALVWFSEYCFEFENGRGLYINEVILLVDDVHDNTLKKRLPEYEDV